MARTKTHAIYLDYIANHTNDSLSTRELRDLINASFDWKYISTYGPIPSESVIQKETKRLKSLALEAINERSQWLGVDVLDEPWRLRRVDPDGVPPQEREWIVTNILTNDFIMRDRALNYPPFSDHLHAVTRRIALWVSSLRKLLRGEHPQLIWSIAWMYSGHELACLNGHSPALRFDTEAFDYYLAYRPWKSDALAYRYRNAVEAGLTIDITRMPLGILHRLQILNLNGYYNKGNFSETRNEPRGNGGSEAEEPTLILTDLPAEQYAQENY